MKVFISWSGERSKALAQAFHDWIPLVLHYVQPWLSEADIEAGDRWAEAVAKELDASNFGIVCITRENVASPWVLFEAGALAKSMQGGKVIPLLLDLDYRDITGPLAQFQAKKVDKLGLSEVVDSINKAAASPVPEPQTKKLFDALWQEFEKQIDSIPKQATPIKHSRPQHEILEDLVASIRTLDSRIRESASESPRSSRPRRHRMHPMMLEEVLHIIGDRPDDPISILLLASFVRDEMPWLYELAREAYSLTKIGPTQEAENAVRRFKHAMDFSFHGPFAEEMGIDPHVMHVLERAFEHGFYRPHQRVLLQEEGAVTKQKRKRGQPST